MGGFQEGFQNALGVFDMAKQGIDEGTARRKQAGLGGLMADYAAGGAPDYQGIAANGGNPLAVRQDADDQKQGRLKELGQFAGYLASIKDPVARNRTYAQLRPKLDAIGQEFQLGPLPEMLDDSHMDELQALEDGLFDLDLGDEVRHRRSVVGIPSQSRSRGGPAFRPPPVAESDRTQPPADPCNPIAASVPDS